MTGTLINAGAVLLGTLAGLLAGARLPESMQARVLAGLGLVTLVLGIDSALEWRDSDPLHVLGGVLLGGIAGEALGIERRLQVLGDRIQRAVQRSGRSRVSEAWVTATLLFCVGPLAVLGPIEDGLGRGHELLLTKAALDGFASIAFAAALGWGVALAAGSILLVQGTIALGAGLFEDVLVGEPLAALTSAGGLLIVGISLKLLDVADVRVANFLPALIFAPVIAGLAG